MARLTRRIAVVSAVALLPLVGSSLASAADTSIGDATAPTTGCSAPYTFLQTSSTAAPFFTAPDGVITSFRIPGDPGVATTRAFKLARSAGGGTWTIVSTTSLTNVAAGTTLTQNVRFPTRAGDVIGVSMGSPSASLCARPGSGSDTITYVTGDAGVGSNLSDVFPGFRVAVSATVESDADHDGFGDTTQDACTTQASTHGVCAFSIGAPGGRAKVGKTLTAPAVAVPPATSETFQWFRVTKKRHHAAKVVAISGATGSTYKLKGKDRGKKVFVRVLLSRPGFDSASADSAPKKVH